MKLVISATSESLDAPFDPRFGRAAFFCVVDADTGKYEAFPNAAREASGGAGVQAAQFVSAQGAKAAISGDFGPKAHAALSAAGVEMFLAGGGEGASCRDLLDRFKEGKLQKIEGPTKPGHHGMGGGMGGGGGRGRSS